MADASLEALLHRLLGARIGQAPLAWPRRVYNFVESAARMTGQTPLALLEQLQSGETPELLEALVDSATIGHTAFFRHSAHFERLRTLLPELSRTRGRPLEIWCAGCSTGEEPYSVALTAREVGVPVQILATDVNRRALEHARTGHYAASPRARLPGDASEWTAPPELRRQVRFLEASITAKASPADAGPFDLIFCRNVLIYFERSVVASMLAALSDRLSPGGSIVVSPADAVLPLPVGLVWGSPPGWLERHGVANAPLRPDSGPGRAAPQLPRVVPHTAPGRPPAQPPPALAEPAGPQAQIERASRLLSSGRAEEAEQLLVSLLNQDPKNVVAWYLLGESLLQRGEQVQSDLAFRRARGLSARDSR